jgi:hypothetical protein
MESGQILLYVLFCSSNTVAGAWRPRCPRPVRLPRRDGANTTERVAASDRVAVAGQRVSTSRAVPTMIAIDLRGLACACS